MAEITIVKGETPAGDRTWMTFPDGTARRVRVHVAHDLPHLVVESLFGIDDGLWGVLAKEGPTRADWPGHRVARAATEAVVNRWRSGPDNPAGVRARLRATPGADSEVGRRLGELADGLDDATIRRAIDGVRRMYATWSSLPEGGTLRLPWPVADRG